MISIAVDIGNSSLKMAVANPNGDSWKSISHFSHQESFEFKLPDDPAVWFVSSVQPEIAERLRHWIDRHRSGDLVRMIRYQDVPLELRLPHPERIGVDRLCAAAAGRDRSQSACIIIDMGTAVTIDGVSPSGEFLGGVIYPGVTPCYQQLAAATKTLPDLSEHVLDQTLQTLHPFGETTEEAIHWGVTFMHIGAIKEVVYRMTQSLPFDKPVFLTGGGVRSIHEYLPSDWLFVEDLVLRGAMLCGRSIASGIEKVAGEVDE